MKKLISIVLSLSLIVAMIPSAFAASDFNLVEIDVAKLNISLPDEATEVKAYMMDILALYIEYSGDWDDMTVPVRSSFTSLGYLETTTIDENDDKEFHYEKDGRYLIILGETASQEVLNESGMLYLVDYYLEPQTTEVSIDATNEGLSNFIVTQSYETGYFEDISLDAWYAESVATVYELGLMSGNSATTFNPSGNVSVAETIVLACRLHSIYYGVDYDYTATTSWYQPYVDYAIDSSIIDDNQFSDYTASIGRGDFALILGNALPSSAFVAINEIEDGIIPDVSVNSDYYDAVYLLYRAGVLTGNDSAGTYTPDAYIERSAVAAIISRIADESFRRSNTLVNVEVASVSLSETSVIANVGDTLELLATISPTNATDSRITWASSNSSVATVDDYGVVTVIAVGVTNITATTNNGIVASCSVSGISDDYSEAILFSYAYMYLDGQLVRNLSDSHPLKASNGKTDIIKNSINTPELVLVATNTTQREIASFEFQCNFTDSFGDVTNDLLGNTIFTGVVQDADLQGMTSTQETIYGGDNWGYYVFNLASWSNAYDIDQHGITITKILFSDGEVVYLNQ